MKKLILLVAILVALAALAVEAYRAIDISTGEYTCVIATVTEKGIKRYGEFDRYLVYTVKENGEPAVFQITDNAVTMRFNSSDVYAGVEVGKKYMFYVRGARVQIMSWYPNIYGYEEVSSTI